MRKRLSYFLLVPAAAALAACSGSAPDEANQAMSEANPTAPASSPATPAESGTAAQAAPRTATDMARSSEVTWANLSSHVGKYLRQINLLESGPISDKLNELLGDKMGVLQRNLEVAGPLQRAGDVYYVVGNAEHLGGVAQAYLLLEPATRAIEVGLWSKGELETFKTQGAAIDKPKDVRTMIANTKPGGPGKAGGAG